MLIPPKHGLIATGEIGMHLSGQQRILGNVCAPGVVVEWEDEKPGYADYNAEEGEVGREFEQTRVAPEETCSFDLLVLLF